MCGRDGSTPVGWSISLPPCNKNCKQRSNALPNWKNKSVPPRQSLINPIRRGPKNNASRNVARPNVKNRRAINGADASAQLKKSSKPNELKKSSPGASLPTRATCPMSGLSGGLKPVKQSSSPTKSTADQTIDTAKFLGFSAAANSALKFS